jgi:hypothetical protein
MCLKAKELIQILHSMNPESKILVRLDGSIFPTDNLDEHNDYNCDSPDEYYILALEDWEDT